MKFAYLILAHEKPNQLNYLVSSILNEDTKIFIHLDKKCDINIFHNALEKYKNDVIFLDDRIDIHWGTFSMVEATIKLFECYLNSKFNANYIHLISGVCLPIKPNDEIKKFFCNNNKNYLNYELVNIYDNFSYRYLYKWILKDSEIIYDGINEKYDNNIKYYKGSQWFSITNECLEYLYNIYNNGVYNEKFKYIQIPDEMYFHRLQLWLLLH